MISLPGDRAIFLYMEPTDMRKSFHGLCKLVYQHDGRPDDGGYYVFVNRPQTHVKIMFWDGDGMVIYYKRLTQGTFLMPKYLSLQRTSSALTFCGDGMSVSEWLWVARDT